MQSLKVALVQTETHWHDAHANRLLFDSLLAGVQSGTDLIVLPEMFSTGFTMAAETVAESMDGPTVAWLKDMSQKLGAVICGSTQTKRL